MMNRARALPMAALLSLRKSPSILWSGTSRAVSDIWPSRKSYRASQWCRPDKIGVLTIVADRSMCRPSGASLHKPYEDDVWRPRLSA